MVEGFCLALFCMKMAPFRFVLKSVRAAKSAKTEIDGRERPTSPVGEKVGPALPSCVLADYLVYLLTLLCVMGRSQP